MPENENTNTPQSNGQAPAQSANPDPAKPQGTQGQNDAVTPDQQAAPDQRPFTSVYDRYFSKFGKPAADEGSQDDNAPDGNAEGDAAARGAEALISELSALKQSISELRSQGEHAAANKAQAQVKSFMEHLQAGDIEGAEAALTSKLEAQLTNKIIGEATRKAVAVANAQNEVATFAQSLLTQNPELVPVQDLIEQNAQYMVQQARNAGIVKEGDLAGYVQAYKSALRQSIDRFSGFGRGAANAGAQNASARNNEVLRTGVIPPSAQNGHSASQPGGNNGASPASFEDQVAADRAYLQARKAERDRLRGMG